MSLRVAARKFGFAFAVIVPSANNPEVWQVPFSIWRQAPTDAGLGGWSEHAIDDSRCFSLNGDSDRQCRSKSTFEPIQSSVWVMRQERYGLRGERVGEASNPSLVQEVEGVASTQEDPMRHTDLELYIST